ncbi:MAG TPA: DUF4199 domain-containing protein [Flavobacteriales bacterium]|nr:DUF4199 domain-containing protein [Flavobacteriales bacterium]
MFDKEFKEFVLQSGMVLGLVYGIISFATYFMGVETMVSLWTIVISLAIAIGAPIYYGVKWKQFKGGYLDFKPAFMVIFLVYALSSLISTVFSYTLNTVIDPELPEALFNESLKFTVRVMEMVDAPEAQIDKALDQIKAEKEVYGLGAELKHFFTGLGFGAVIALIGGAIIKKRPDVFEQE